MNVTAISSIPRVAAPYPARIPMLDDTRPTWEAERATAQRAAEREALRNQAAQDAWEARRIARTRQVSDPSSPHVANPAPRPADTVDRPPIVAAPALANLDALRDQYADTRLRRAVDAYSQQAGADPVAQRGSNANDLGTIEGLTPLQPYRVAMGNPQVQELQAAVAVKAAGVGIPAVANIGATENVTDNARYRPGFANRPDA